MHTVFNSLVLKTMPRGKDASSLKQLCLKNIVQNFDRTYGSYYDRHLGDVPRLLYVIGPFENLPGDLCQDIIHLIIQYRILHRPHLHLLLLPQVTRVNFSGGSTTTVSAQALEVLSLQCRNLVSLNLANCLSLSPRAITQCLTSLPLLSELILKRTKANDNVMKTIATSLSQLTHLDIFACPVTSKGAEWLCGDGEDFEPVCTNLIKLDISATEIDIPGCCTIIQTFPRLRHLSFADTIEAVAVLHSAKDDRLKERHKNCLNKTESSSSSMVFTGSADQHQLQILHATALKCRHVSPESVQVACVYCPYVREVYLYQHASNASLNYLASLQHLAVLEVTSDQPGDVTFHEGLLPLLHARGEGMIGLGLYDVQDVDLAKVGVLCPSLQRLKVVSMFEDADFSSSFLLASEIRTTFCHLRKLTIIIGPDITRLGREDMQNTLLNASLLEDCHLINVQCLTDDTLILALSRHGFRHLREMQLELCNNITSGSLTQLVHSNNPLSSLSVKNCENVTYQDYQDLTSHVSRACLNLTINWE